jgi:uncharacterized protein (DUF433 family)
MATTAAIDVKEALRDIRSGMGGDELMKKYNLSSKGLQSLLSKLHSAGLIKQEQFELLMGGPSKPPPGVKASIPAKGGGESATGDGRPAEKSKPRLSKEAVIEDIKAGMPDSGLMHKYGLTAKALENMYAKLIDLGKVTVRDFYDPLFKNISPFDPKVVFEQFGYLAPGYAGAGARGGIGVQDASDAIPGTEDAGVAGGFLGRLLPAGAAERLATLALPLFAGIAVLLALGAGAYWFMTRTPAAGADMVNSLNTGFKGACRAAIIGTFNDTLVVDWTRSTTSDQAQQIKDRVNKERQNLAKGGVRHFKFPSDKGTYQLMDLQTGETKTTDEKALTFFK